jgi:HlyD family secretion protein
MVRAATLALVPLVGLASGCAPVDDGEAATAPAFTTSAAEPSTFRVTVTATGIVEPLRSLEVKSLAAGEITELHADVGDRVEAGALLVEVDPRDVRNAHQEALAELEVARARMEIARTQLERSEELLRSGVITQQEHEGQTLEFANARSVLVRAETNLQLAEQRLADVRIRAPLPGTILTRSVDRGQVISSASGNVSGGTTLFTMADLDRVQVRIRVPEADLGLVVPGQSVDVRPQAFPDRIFRGEVQKVEPQAITEQNVVVFPVLILLDNPEGLLRPGMNSAVEILVAEYPEALTIPATAVVQLRQVPDAAGILGADLSGWSEPVGAAAAGPANGTRQAQQAAVFVQGTDGRIAPRVVVVAPGDGSRVRVLEGLADGDLVVSFSTAGSDAAGGGFPGGGGGPPR